MTDAKWDNWSGYGVGMLSFLVGLLAGSTVVPWLPVELRRTGLGFSRAWWEHVDWGVQITGARWAADSVRQHRLEYGPWPLSLDEVEMSNLYRAQAEGVRYFPPRRRHDGFVLAQGTPQTSPPWELEGRSAVMHLDGREEYIGDVRLEALLHEYEASGEVVAWPQIQPPGSTVVRTGTFLGTEGPYLDAQIEYDGRVYTVMDEISPIDRPGPEPGQKVEFEFECGFRMGDDWEYVFKGNPEKRYGLEQIKDWRYRAYGRIIAVNPVVADCGLLQVEDVVQSHDRRIIGEWVAFTIDRLHATRHVAPEGEKDA